MWVLSLVGNQDPACLRQLSLLAAVTEPSCSGALKPQLGKVMCHSKKPAQQKREKKTTSLSSLPQDNSMGIRVLLGGTQRINPKSYTMDTGYVMG